MGIETILIVFGVVLVIAVSVGAMRAKRKAANTQAPGTTGSTRRRRR